MEISDTVVLSAIATIAGVLGTGAKKLWDSMERREERQNERSDRQDKIMEGLHSDITRLSGGCGMESCLWKTRHDIFHPKKHIDTKRVDPDLSLIEKN